MKNETKFTPEPFEIPVGDEQDQSLPEEEISLDDEQETEKENKNKFTPGPRVVIGDYNVEGPNREFVGTFGCNGRDIEIGKANAILDAAAPDMLKALQMMVKWARESVVPVVPAGEEFLPVGFEKALTAISKALAE